MNEHTEWPEARTLAHSAALCVLRMDPKRMIYMQPYRRLMKAQMRDNSAENRETGLAAAVSICKIVKIALGVESGYDEEKEPKKALTTAVKQR